MGSVCGSVRPVGRASNLCLAAELEGGGDGVEGGGGDGEGCSTLAILSVVVVPTRR
jgi:hypothetical protein